MKYSNGITIKDGDYIITDEGYERFQILNAEPEENDTGDPEMFVGILSRGGDINTSSDEKFVLEISFFTSGEAVFIARGSINDHSDLWSNPVFEQHNSSNSK